MEYNTWRESIVSARLIQRIPYEQPMSDSQRNHYCCPPAGPILSLAKMVLAHVVHYAGQLVPCFSEGGRRIALLTLPSLVSRSRT